MVSPAANLVRKGPTTMRYKSRSVFSGQSTGNSTCAGTDTGDSAIDQHKKIIQKKTRRALEAVLNSTRIEKAYMLRSQGDGTADQWSDIDLAVFVEGAESWDIHKPARRIAAMVQKEAGDDIELHFIPAISFQNESPGGNCQ